MLYIVKTIANRVLNSRRLIKLLRLGKDDTQEVYQAAPYGTDSVPIKDAVAIYGPTSVSGEAVVIGYVSQSALAQAGEHRTYSTDADGAVQFYIWQKADGTCEIGGTGDFMMRYTPMNTELQSLASFINTELGKIATGITGAGGAYTPGTCSIDISAAKIEQIKTIPSS